MWTKFRIAAVLAVLASLASVITVYAASPHQTTTVFEMAPPNDVIPGSSASLMRDDDGVTATLKTSDLEAGAVYTVWWVIFNNPESCADVCGLADLGTPEVEPGVYFAAGHVIGNNGKANFGMRLNEDTLPDGPGQIPFAGLDNPLMDSMKAEVHLVVRTHGEPIPGLVDAMISSFGGGCTADSDPSGVGPEGPNECEDVQAAVFEAP